MELSQVLAGLPVRRANDVEGAGVDVTGVSHDSRKVVPGDLFVAWEGEVFDGRRYAPQAVDQGAVAVLASVGGDPLPGVPWLEADDPRRLLGPLAARVFAHPDRDLRMVGITGTNGKTTVSYLVQAILDRAGIPTGVLGTLGYHFRDLSYPGERTTPEAADLYRCLCGMRDAGAEGIAMEVSSHALDQGRVFGATFEVAVFTNLTRDHLDYHGDMESYFEAKTRLFEQLGPDGVAVLNADDPRGRELAARLPRTVTFATDPEAEADVVAVRADLDAQGSSLEVRTPRSTLRLRTQLRGSYNVSNICAAIAVGEAMGIDPEHVVAALEAFEPVDGRLDPVDAGQSFPVFLDYAHTDGGLDAALRSLRDLHDGPVVLVFGCGGGRDQGKRALMGRVAGELSDVTILTDDNPRGEDPRAIHRQVVTGLRAAGRSDYHILGDRRRAIRAALQHASEHPGCAVLVAGKGHEREQIVGDQVRSFSDAEEIRGGLEALARGERIFDGVFDPDVAPDPPPAVAARLARGAAAMARWKMSDAVLAMRGEVRGPAPESFEGIALDSRKIEGGELFFALAGAETDGHRFVRAALDAGAAAAVVERDDVDPGDGCVVRVPDSLEALHDLTRWVRERTPEHLVGITGSAGKTTTKQLLAAMLEAKYAVAASPGNLNNLYGFPVSLLGIPADTEWMVAEMGMSTPGELGGVSRLGRPDVAVFTNVRRVHLEAFDEPGKPATVRDIGNAKAELLEGLRDDGLVVANADDPEVRRIAQIHLDRSEQARVVWYSPSGTCAEPVRLEVVGEVTSSPGGVDLTARADGETAAVHLPLHGAVNVENFLAAATCALELGVTLGEIAASVRELDLGAGRGRILELDGATVIDDVYNSNQDALLHAVRAALEVDGSRHWAVLGEMRELGQSSEAIHTETGEALAELGLEHVLAVGEDARAMAAALERAGASCAWVASAEEAAELASQRLTAGDVLLVKGSRGVRLEVVVERLQSDRGGVS